MSPQTHETLIQPELRSLLIPDYPLADSEPHLKDPEVFGLELTAYIGPAGQSDVADAFEFTVCTPKWLMQHMNDGGPRVLRAYALTEKWDASIVQSLEDTIRDICRGINAPSWGAAAARLARWFIWEFEYHYDELQDSRREYPY